MTEFIFKNPWRLNEKNGQELSKSLSLTQLKSVPLRPLPFELVTFFVSLKLNGFDSRIRVWILQYFTYQTFIALPERYLEDHFPMGNQFDLDKP